MIEKEVISIHLFVFLLPTRSKSNVVKTTTKQTLVQDQDGVTQNIEERVEDLRSGAITISTQFNKVRYQISSST